MRRAGFVAGAALLVGLCAGLAAAQEPAEHGLEAERSEGIRHEAEEVTGHSLETESHDEEHHAPWYRNQDLWKFINLSVILYIGLRMGGGALGSMLRQRSQTIRTDLEEARLALETAERKLDDAEYRLARLHDELEALRQEGQRVEQAERERLLAETQAAVEEMQRRTQFQIQLETQQAKRELRRYMATLIVERVREELRSRVEREGDAPFVNTILERVEALR